MEFKEPLPEEEQKLLFKKLKETDDPGIKEKLILHNLRLVNWVAMKYYKPGKNDLDDLFQQGVLGLMRAMEDYDIDLGTFANYATWWIRQSITRGVEYDRIVRIPSYMVQEVNRVIKIMNSLTQELGKEPTINEISMAIGLDIEDVSKIMSIINDPVSLNAVIGGDDEDFTLEDTILDDGPRPDEIVEDILLRKELIENIQEVTTDQQYKIIMLRFGFDGESQTLQAIGDYLGRNKEYIRNQESKVLRVLRRTKYFLELKKEFIKDIEDNTIYYRSPNHGRGKGATSVEGVVMTREDKRQRVFKYIDDKTLEFVNGLNEFQKSEDLRDEQSTSYKNI